MGIWEELDGLADWAKTNLDLEAFRHAEGRERTERVRAAIQERLRADVLVRRFIQHVAPGSGGRNTEPWQALGEKRYAALSLSLIGSTAGRGVLAWAPYPSLSGDLDDDLGSIQAVGLAMLVASPLTVPYLWLTDVEEMVRALPLPRHVVGRNLLPHPWMFFSFEVAWGPARGLGGADFLDGGYTDWCLLRDNRTCMEVLVPLHFNHHGPSEKQSLILPMTIPYGKTWPDDFAPGEVEPVGVILKRLAFVNSPYTETIAHRLPRPIRREMKRFGQVLRPEEEEGARTVVLRRAAAEAQTRHDADQAPGPDWRGHWWVSGHFRAQWYPSEEAHKVIWIAPYVKGDLALPLLEKTYVARR